MVPFQFIDKRARKMNLLRLYGVPRALHRRVPRSLGEEAAPMDRRIHLVDGKIATAIPA